MDRLKKEKMVIETDRLMIVQCDEAILIEAIKGNSNIAHKLGVDVPDNWTEFGKEALQYAHNKLEKNSSERGWWTYLPILKSENILIGSGGYKGKPTNEGEIEIGYEITPEFRNQGLATELAKALVENAFEFDQVKLISAHTLGEFNPSTKVLLKCGFEKVEELNDPDEGIIWKWELLKNKTL